MIVIVFSSSITEKQLQSTKFQVEVISFELNFVKCVLIFKYYYFNVIVTKFSSSVMSVCFISNRMDSIFI